MQGYTRSCFLLKGLAVVVGALPVIPSAGAVEAATGKLNVLFIAVDDLRPELGCYGSAAIRSPSIDKLARSGTLFNRAYCQQAVCSPSRTSLLTGRRPDTTKIYDLQTHFRLHLPDVVTLPEHFKRHGYHTQSFGKIYHGGLDDPQSWSVRSWFPQGPMYAKPESNAIMKEEQKRLQAAGKLHRDRVLEANPETGMTLKIARSGARALGPAWEDPDVPDNGLPDGKIADQAVEALRQLKDRPFFLAVGFLKPHLPFVAPKKYFDLYPPAGVRLADNPFPPKDVPPIALTDWGELRSYYGIPRKGPLTDEQARELVRAYHAAVSYTDAQIGRVLDELDRLGLRDRTVVVLWGDHGWQLGEHGLWCKHTNFEIAARAPMILSAPGQRAAGAKTDALAEFVDIYPTLCELASLPLPEGLEGTSLAPVMKDPARPWKKAAFSQYPRNEVMGHSIRTDRYRYTEWAEPGAEPAGVELYDHTSDPNENVNLAGRPENKELVAGLSKMLHAGWREARPEKLARTPDPRPSILFAIADDWSYPHAGVFGDKVVKTPTFDRLAEQGVLLPNTFCAAPSCTPSRGAILTGQAIHRLAEGGNLWSSLPKRFEVYPDLLERAGYHVGFTRKGWGPGQLEPAGRSRNPAGPQFKDFAEFLKSTPEGKPFCFWFGSTDPHRAYEQGSGLKAGMKLEDVVVPPFLPDTPEVRSDILDYYVEVQRFDREVGELLDLLQATGRADNTIVVMTSDNGMPFPRCKTNLYDGGTRMPLAVRWPAKINGGRVLDAFISFTDFAPTFLEAAGLKPPAEMTGHGFLSLLTGSAATGQDHVFLERERHANTRKGDLSYPCRAIRTREFLYVRNVCPDRWPAGDPERYHSVGAFGDIDGSPTKDVLLNGRDDPKIAPFFRLACDKRPAEELYDLAKDPAQIHNVADQPGYADARKKLRAELDRWMAETADPRAANEHDDRWDRYPYYGERVPKPPASKGTKDK